MDFILLYDVYTKLERCRKDPSYSGLFTGDRRSDLCKARDEILKLLRERKRKSNYDIGVPQEISKKEEELLSFELGLNDENWFPVPIYCSEKVHKQLHQKKE